jgi:hypothetical protein
MCQLVKTHITDGYPIQSINPIEMSQLIYYLNNYSNKEGINPILNKLINIIDLNNEYQTREDIRLINDHIHQYEKKELLIEKLIFKIHRMQGRRVPDTEEFTVDRLAQLVKS